MDKVNSYRDLVVYQKAFKLAVAIFKVSSTFPKDEKFGGITDQMRRSSRSVCANLAEGFGRWGSKTEERRFLSIALGSLEETCVWLDFCQEFEFMTAEKVLKYHEAYDEVRRILKAMMYKRR